MVDMNNYLYIPAWARQKKNSRVVEISLTSIPICIPLLTPYDPTINDIVQL